MVTFCLLQVQGLSFGHRANAFLASGGSEGQILVWDLNDLTKEEVPTFEVLIIFRY